MYKNSLLVHLQLGKNFGIRMNNNLRYAFDVTLQDEQFSFKKASNKGKSKMITRDIFNKKLKRFDMNQTVISKEILEDYAYTDRCNRPDEVQIILKEKNDNMVAIIDFKDMEQLNNFVCPAWLIKIIE